MDDLCLTFDGALTIDESLNFDQDGEVRYFGPSSGRLLFRSAMNDSPGGEQDQPYNPYQDWSITPPESAGKTPVCGDQLSDLPCVPNEFWASDELRAHLIDLYFEWEQPWLQVVNEQLFRDSLACGGRYCNPLLLNCILALGARYSERLDVRSDPNDPNTAGKLFLENAERLVANDLRWPKITTIQSLAIMGMVYVAMGSDAAGWLHQGMAGRLALDMGLNMDPAVLAGAVSLPPIEIELRRQIYWALYCTDKLSATYTGRVCTLMDSQGAVNKPFLQCASNETRLAANGQPRAASQRDVVKLHHAMIDLSRILEKILGSFWSPKPLIHTNQRCAFFDSCVLELKTWYYDLPSELKIDRPSGPSRFPHAYTLCMVYHTAWILLCGPFLYNFYHHSKGPRSTESTPQKEENLPEAERSEKALAACGTSVRAICITAQQYRITFGSFKLSPITATHCILSAALTIIDKCCTTENLKQYNPADKPQPGASPHAAVGLCLQVLRELSTSWNIAKRIGRNLEKLYCDRFGSDHLPNPPDAAHCVAARQGLGGGVPGYGMTPTLAVFDDFYNEKPTPMEKSLCWSTQHVTEFPPSDELFANNLGFAFSPDCLPSDYNMFDTLNQMYLEERW
ncbi:hypothetical protein N7512_002217 [Penicillium capsulatum]|nr:hypothetical protein N7512_002217 [Penicillium capsulatum]